MMIHQVVVQIRPQVERMTKKTRIRTVRQRKKDLPRLKKSVRKKSRLNYRYLDNQKSVLNSNLSKLAYFSAFTPNLEEIKSILTKLTGKHQLTLSHAITKEWSIFNVSKLTDSLAIFQELYQTEVNQKERMA